MSVCSLNNMATGIAVGILEIFKGMVDKTIQIIGHLVDPINAIEHALYDATKPFADELYGLLVLFEVWVERAYNKVVGILDKIPGIKKILHPVEMPTATEIRAGQAGFEQTVSLGFRPGVNLRVNQQAQAVFDAQADAWIKQIEQSPNIFTGAPSTYGTQRSQQAAGQTFLEQLNAWLKKHQITLPALPTGGGVTGVPDVGVPGGTGGAAAGGTTSKDLVQAAKDAFDLLLEKGPVTWAAGMKDIARIALAEHAAKTPDSQVVLDVLRDTKQLVDKLLGQAQKHFDFDAHVAHPSIQKLHQDEANYLAILAKTPGITPVDIATARQSMDQQIASLFNKTASSGQMPVVPSPAYGTYGGLATGYGQTTVSFGGTQQSGWAAVVAELRAQLAFWRSRALAEQRQLDAQQQTAQNTAQIARNTQSAADKMDQPGRGSAALPAATAVRGVGGFQIMRRV